MRIGPNALGPPFLRFLSALLALVAEVARGLVRKNKRVCAIALLESAEKERAPKKERLNDREFVKSVLTTQRPAFLFILPQIYQEP